MKRRDFIKLMSFASGTAFIPNSLLTNNAYASPPYSGTLFINVHVNGGWDTSSICDPKQRIDVNHWALNHTIKNASNLRYAPFADNQSFFDKYSQDILVINGVHSRTNSHTAGSRHQLTGNLGEDYPTPEGLLSITAGQGIPLAFLARTSFSRTAGGLVTYTRPSAGAVRQASLPNMRTNNSQYFSQTAMDIVKQAQIERSARSLLNNHAPKISARITELMESQSGRDSLRQFGESLPSAFAVEDLSGNRYRQITEADIALHAMNAGVCCSAGFQIGGFDTHSDHDNRHSHAMTRLTNFIDFIWEKSTQFGIQNRIILSVFSDFSRTPRYNSGNGKDHWPVGSVIVMKKNVSWTNRVVGATTGTHEAIPINPSTLQEDSTNGIIIEPKHVHAMLRRIAGIENDATANQFDLNAEFIDFLNPNFSTGYPYTS